MARSGTQKPARRIRRSEPLSRARRPNSAPEGVSSPAEAIIYRIGDHYGVEPD